MFLSVAICTWNRADLLEQTLAEFLHLAPPRSADWELIVVNNNSSDRTPEVLANYSDRLPIRVVFEPRLGLSRARNAAVAAARGDYLVWTDDDVLVDPDWLNQYADAFQQYPGAAFFGGSIEPWYEVQPPQWIQEYLPAFETAYAIRRFGRSIRYLSRHEYPFGANMAFPAPTLQRYRFDPDIGQVGAGTMRGDETTLFDRICQDGGVGVCVGSALVRHYIPKQRLTQKYLWGYYFGGGQTLARLDGRLDVPHWFGMPRFALRQLFEWEISKWWWWMRRDHRWPEAFIKSAECLGYLAEAGRRRTRLG